MAIIFGVVDEDPTRREQALTSASALLSEHMGLKLSARRFSSGSTGAVVCTASKSTPFSVATSEVPGGEETALVVGDYNSPALGADGRGAHRLLLAGVGAIGGQNGYYLAVHVDQHGTVHLGVDFLSYFPLYYWTDGNVLLFGTSPKLFETHSSYVSELSATGLISILLYSHPVDSLTAYKGVYRIKPGESLAFTPNKGMTKCAAPLLRGGDVLADIDLADAQSEVDRLLNNYFETIAGHPEIDVLLSGGMDSRLVAGYVSNLKGERRARAVSIGRESDNELTLARTVASELRWEHRAEDVSYAAYPKVAAQTLSTESMGHTFLNLGHGKMIEVLAETDSPFISGYNGNNVFEDDNAWASFDRATRSFGIEKKLQSMNAYGFTAEHIETLLECDDFADRVAGINEKLTGEWLESGEEDWQKSRVFSLHNRSRNHACAVPWRLSIASWPLIPYIDAPLVTFMCKLPLKHLTNRPVMAGLMKDRFPRLARLPFDANGLRLEYLIKPLHIQLRDRLPNPARIGWMRNWLKSRRKLERRYYHRVFDYNSDGWKAVRASADAATYRGLQSPMISLQVNKLLGNPDSNMAHQNEVVDTSKHKTLVGVAMLNSDVGAGVNK